MRGRIVAFIAVGLAALQVARVTQAYPGHVFQSPAPAVAPTSTEKAASEEQTQSVDPTGAAHYSVPISVPPGRQGMAPSLGLSYSSRNPIRGGVAAGWSLAMPRIEVDTSEGRLKGTYYRSALTGTRLVKTPDTAPSDAETYRAEYDASYARYERVKNADGSTKMWRVRSLDGRVSYFGETVSSKDVTHQASPGVTEGRWFLTRQVDPFGNTVEYTYAKVNALVVGASISAPVDIYPTAISWGLNGNAGLAHHARVSFSYTGGEKCPGSQVPIGAQFTYRTGFPLMEGYKRLTAVRVEILEGATWRERRRYDLGYDMTELSCPTGLAHAPLRLLTSVSEVVTNPDGTVFALPALTFDYGRRDLELTATLPVVPVGRGSEALSNSKPGGWPTIDQMMLDLDGDGVLDRLTSDPLGSSTSCRATWERSNGDGTFQAAAPLTLPAMPWRGSSRQDTGPMFEREGCSLSHQYSRADTVEPGTCGAPAGYQSYRFMDVTGDGRPDLVTAIDANRGQYQTEDDPRLWPSGTPACTNAGACRDAQGQPTICKVVSQLPWPPFTNNTATFAPTPGALASEPPPEDVCFDGSCPYPDCEADCECSPEYCEPDAVYYYVHFGAPTQCVAGPDNPNGQPDAQGECQSDKVWLGVGWKQGPSGDEGKIVPGTFDPACIPWPESTCGRYIWRVYANTGAGFASTPQIVMSPVPLESDRATSSLGAAQLAAASSWHGFVDLDGDGQLDAIHMAPFFTSGPSAEPTNPPLQFDLFRGDGAGGFLGVGNTPNGAPFAWRTPSMFDPGLVRRYRARIKLTDNRMALPYYPNDDNVGASGSQTILADINGDGLADYLDARQDGRVRVFLNHGKGFESAWNFPEFMGATLETAAWGTEKYRLFDETQQLRLDAYDNGQVEAGWSRAVLRPVDIDADGLLDLAVIQAPRRNMANPWLLEYTEPHVRLFVNTGDKLIPMGTPPSVQAIWPALARITISRGHTQEAQRWEVETDFVDLDGDGLPEAFNNDASVASCWPDTSKEYGIACGNGTTSLTTARDGRGMRLLSRVRNGRGGEVRFEYAPVRGLPHPLWAVTKVTTGGGAGMPEMATTYAHEGPVYQRDHRDDWGFRGFTKVHVTAPSGAKTTTRYDYAQHWGGLAVDVRTYEANGHAHTIETRTYTRNELFGGKVAAYHPRATENRRCGAAQDEATCATAGVLSYQLQTWTPKRSTIGNTAQDLAWVLGTTYTSETIAPKDGSKLAHHTYVLRADANNHRLFPDLDVGQVYLGPVETADVRKKQHVWDNSWRVEHLTYVWTGAAGPIATTRRMFNMQTGNLAHVSRPSNEGEWVWTIFGYDPTHTFVRYTTNELGHITEDTWDLATGAQTAHRGPNMKNNIREGWVQKVDGLGRVLERSVYVDDAALGYKPVVVAKTTYYDAPTPVLDGLIGSITKQRVELAEDRWTHSERHLDGAGRGIASVERYGGSIVSRSRNHFDAAGNRWRVDVPDPNGSGSATVAYTYQYDSLGRPILALRPDQTGLRWIYDGALTTREDVVGTAGGATGKTRTRRDGFGRLVEVAEHLDIDDGVWATTTYQHDGNDNIKRVVDADGVVTVMQHDWRSNRTRIIRGDKVWKYAYNLDGQLESFVVPHPAGTNELDYTTTIVYDNIGREISRLTGNRALTNEQLALYGAGTIQRKWDENPSDNGIGRLGYVTTPLGTTSYRYEARGLIRERTDGFSILGGTVGDQRTSRFVYNALGGVAEETFGDHADPAQGTRIQYATLDCGWLWKDNWLNKNRRIANYSSTAAGIVSSRSLPGVYDHRTNRDSSGRVTEQWVRTKLPGTTGLATRVNVRPHYDGAGDVDSMLWLLAPDGVGTTETFGFAYDSRHQIAEASGAAGYTASFVYTAAGRLEYASVDASAAAVDVEPREVAYDYHSDGDPETPDRLVSNDGSAWLTLDHDLAGNTIARDGVAGGFTHVYDGFDRQREVVAPDGRREVYWYGGEGARSVIATFSASGSVERVRWTSGSTEIWYGPDHLVSKTIAHVARGGTPVARIENRATIEHVFADHYGHTLAEVADNGTMVAGFVYGPFGEILREAGVEVLDTLRRFNGKEHDELSGLSYYGARYYDPSSLTWTQGDPLYRFAPDNAWDEPRRMSAYAFSLNNPMLYFDPDGADSELARDAAVEGLLFAIDKYAPPKSWWGVLKVSPGIGALYAAATFDTETPWGTVIGLVGVVYSFGKRANPYVGAGIGAVSALVSYSERRGRDLAYQAELDRQQAQKSRFETLQARERANWVRVQLQESMAARLGDGTFEFNPDAQVELSAAEYLLLDAWKRNDAVTCTSGGCGMVNEYVVNPYLDEVICIGEAYLDRAISDAIEDGGGRSVPTPPDHSQDVSVPQPVAGPRQPLVFQ